MKRDCIIIGSGTYGQVYAEYLKEEYNIVAFYDDDESLHGSEISGISVVGNVMDAFKLENTTSVFVPIGNNPIRVKILREFENKGFQIPSFIHPHTIIHPSVKIGERCIYTSRY